MNTNQETFTMFVFFLFVHSFRFVKEFARNELYHFTVVMHYFWCIFFDYVIINPFIYYIHFNYINKYLSIWKLNAFIVKYISFDTTTKEVIYLLHGKKLFLPSSLVWNMFFCQWIGMDRIRSNRIGFDLIWLAHALVINIFFLSIWPIFICRFVAFCQCQSCVIHI